MHCGCVHAKALNCQWSRSRTLSFISKGTCTYVQAVSRSDRQVHGESRLWKCFHCIQFYEWNALMCTLWLQNTSTDYFTTVQSAAQPTSGLSTNGLPKSTTCPSLTTHTVLSCCSSTGWLPTATTVERRMKWPPEQCSSEMPSCCQWSR